MKETFSPVPARAIGDARLSALDLRVLAAIASHDRMSKNGIGCTAGHGRLANLVGAHLKSLSRSIRTLAECGYVGGRANPVNPKSKCYFVVYNEFDAALLKSTTGNEVVTSNRVTGNEAATQQVTTSFPIGNRVEKNGQQNHGDRPHNIFSEAINKSCEAIEINPAEAGADAPLNNLGATDSGECGARGDVAGLLKGKPDRGGSAKPANVDPDGEVVRLFKCVGVGADVAWAVLCSLGDDDLQRVRDRATNATLDDGVLVEALRAINEPTSDGRAVMNWAAVA